MLCPIFTLDYEIHGNGEGDPLSLMVEPTERMMEQFESYGAKLTIMADVAEILRFGDYFERFGKDDFHYKRITRQLQDAIVRGHDVQLHIHSSWFGATFESGRWNQDWTNYSFANLPLDRIHEYLSVGKQWLESLLSEVDPTYKCTVFRAANWSMHPSRNASCALKQLGFRIDSSVFKWGSRQGLVTFDYTDAHHPLLPWPASDDDVCRKDPSSALWEFPIYAEHRNIGAFFNIMRLYRVIMSRTHRLKQVSPEPDRPTRQPSTVHRILSKLTGKHSWKADFNQCTGYQLVSAINRAEKLIPAHPKSIRHPFVLIGHSKLFTRINQRSLSHFLSYIQSHQDRFAFATFKEFQQDLTTSGYPSDAGLEHP